MQFPPYVNRVQAHKLAKIIKGVCFRYSMPLYEYKCQSCGEKFEVIQKFSDTPLTVHEKCGGPVERLISTSALKFKGTGWYVTDYGGSGKSSGNGKNDSGKDEKKDSKSNSKD